jgi:hypothetical protein
MQISVCSFQIWIVYRLFAYEHDFKWKNFELQNCRSHRKLQFSYKVYLHPNSCKKVTIFLNMNWKPRSRYENWDLDSISIIWLWRWLQIEKILNYKVVDLIESYNFHIKLPPSEFKKKLKTYWTPVAVPHGGSRHYSTARASNAVGQAVVPPSPMTLDV